MRRIRLLIFLLFIVSTGFSLEMDFSISFYAERNVPFLYRSTILAQYEPIIRDRIAFRDRDIITSELKISHKNFGFAVQVPYIFLRTSATNHDFGEFNIRMEHDINFNTKLNFSILGGIQYALSTGKEKYLIEKNPAMNNLDLYGGGDIEIQLLPYYQIFSQFIYTRIGKSESDKKFDTLNLYRYGPHFTLTFGNAINFEWKHFSLCLQLYSILEYQASLWNSYEQLYVDKTEYMTWELATAFELLVFDQLVISGYGGFMKYTIPNGRPSPIIGIEIGYHYSDKTLI